MYAFFHSVNSLLFLAPQHRFAGSVKEINKGNQIIEQLQNAQVCYDEYKVDVGAPYK